MSVINLPSGASVVVREAKTIKQGDRRKVYAVINGNADANDFKSGMQVIDAVIALMVESWTLDLIPPSVKIESLDELSLEDYDTLQDAATKFMPILFPNLGKTLETDADPKVITENFNA